MQTSTHAQPDPTQTHFDAVIIGAGISGIYQLYMLRQRGLSVRAFDAAGGIGGTWFWNRYPGCRFDSESYTYGYSFSRELFEEWNWSEEFAPQPETERYLNHVVDKFDLRRDIQLNTRIASASYDEARKLWVTVQGDGTKVTCRYLISAVGNLSIPTLPRVPGVESFEGEAYHTSRWPKNEVELKGRRVAVIGTGSTGVQMVQEAAKAADQVFVFQRTPNWCAPLVNRPIPVDRMKRIHAKYEKIFDQCDATFAGFLYEPDPRSALDVSETEREVFFEYLYNSQGFRIWLGGFQDNVRNRDANRLLSEFVEKKIRQRVKDPAVADKLVPKDHGFGTRRVPLETSYYECYNQPNVELIDTKATPITRITPTGIETADRRFDLDLIVYATGFDAITGGLDAIDIRGRDGRMLKDYWEAGPRTAFGTMADGFPNLFMIVGPLSAIGNFPRSIEFMVEWISGLIDRVEEGGLSTIEPRSEAVQAWVDHCTDVATGHMGLEIRSWATGVNLNVKGRENPRLVRYFGSNVEFRRRCKQETADGYPGMLIS